MSKLIRISERTLARLLVIGPTPQDAIEKLLDRNEA